MIQVLRPRREKKAHSLERDGGHRQQPVPTNAHATSLGTKLGNGLALAGGNTNALGATEPSPF